MKEFTLTNKKNNKINILEGENIDQIKGLIIHIHGLGSHFQPLYECIDELHNRDNFFIKYKYKTYGLEFEGHGKSEGTKCCIESFDDLLDDLELLLNHLKTIYSNEIPIYLFSESMGCSVALKYCITRENNIKGLIFLAPLFGIDEKLIPNVFLETILLWVAYYFPQLPLLKNSSNLTNISTTNKDFLEAKDNNEYTYHGSHRLCTGRELLNISKWIKDNGHLLKIPIIVFHGLKDSITQPTITKELFEKFVIENKEIHLIEEAYHCLLIECCENPTIPNFIIDKIIKWLDK
jgi:acylglycerol lipase